jgi:hypothetical protein
MVDEDCAVVDSPFTFALAVAIQLKLDGTDDVNPRFTVVLSQIVSEDALFMIGVGSTVTVMVCVGPTQLPGFEVGVT